MPNVTVKQSTLEDALTIMKSILEFHESHSDSVEEYHQRIDGKDPMIFIGYFDNEPAGFLIAYNKYDDGSWYCWLAGVHPSFRRNGIHSALMKTFESAAREKGYRMASVKTRNNRREMLAYLVKNKWMFTGVETKDSPEENRILLTKQL